MAEVGTALGISEDAAKKRVASAVDRLREMLGRRGVVAPAFIFSTALFTHTTHAAPATLALSATTASASTGAATIAKGAATMLFTAKLKAVAAAILMIALLPTGIGAILLAAPHMTASTPPPAANPPAIAPLAIAVPAEPQLDPRIAPFVNAQTDLLVIANADKIDVDALQGDFQGVLIDSNLDPKALSQITQSVQSAADKLNPWLTKFKNAGGHNLYIAVDLAQLFQGNLPALIFPVDNGTDPQALATYLKLVTSPAANASPQQAAMSVSVIGQAVIVAAPAMIEQLKAVKPEPRPDLAAALAFGSGAVRLAFAPLQLEKSPALATLGMQAAFNDPLWQNVAWGLVDISLPPSEPAGLVGTYKCKDAASAQSLVKLARDRLAEAQKTPGILMPIPGVDFGKLTQNLTITADNDTVRDSIDLKQIEDFLLRMFISLHGVTPKQ